MSTLATELANEAAQSHIRNAAGLAIKNALSAREAQRSAEYAERWFKLTIEARNEIKQKVFAALASQDSRAGLSSAQVLASIAAVELPVGQSQDMIGQLLSQMGDVSNVNLRRATLQAIGFICETSVSVFTRHRKRRNRRKSREADIITTPSSNLKPYPHSQMRS